MEKDMSKALRRKRDFHKAQRKRNIAKSIYNETCEDGVSKSHEHFDNLHQYSKNHIHESCRSDCRKTRNVSRRHVIGNYAPSFNPSASDKRKLEQLYYEEEDNHEE